MSDQIYHGKLRELLNFDLKVLYPFKKNFQQEKVDEAATKENASDGLALDPKHERFHRVF